MSEQQFDRKLPKEKKPLNKGLLAGIVAVIVVIGVVVALLVGRGGDGEKDKPTTAPSPGGTKLEQYPVPSSKKLKKSADPEKAKQVKISSCEKLEEGGWQAMGTVNNKTNKSIDYTITVFFSSGDKTINYADTKVTAPAKTKVPWVAGKVFGTDYELECRVEAVS